MACTCMHCAAQAGHAHSRHLHNRSPSLRGHGITSAVAGHEAAAIAAMEHPAHVWMWMCMGMGRGMGRGNDRQGMHRRGSRVVEGGPLRGMPGATVSRQGRAGRQQTTAHDPARLTCEAGKGAPPTNSLA